MRELSVAEQRYKAVRILTRFLPHREHHCRGADPGRRRVGRPAGRVPSSMSRLARRARA